MKLFLHSLSAHSSFGLARVFFMCMILSFAIANSVLAGEKASRSDVVGNHKDIGTSAELSNDGTLYVDARFSNGDKGGGSLEVKMQLAQVKPCGDVLSGEKKDDDEEKKKEKKGHGHPVHEDGDHGKNCKTDSDCEDRQKCVDGRCIRSVSQLESLKTNLCDAALDKMKALPEFETINISDADFEQIQKKIVCVHSYPWPKGLFFYR